MKSKNTLIACFSVVMLFSLGSAFARTIDLHIKGHGCLTAEGYKCTKSIFGGYVCGRIFGHNYQSLSTKIDIVCAGKSHHFTVPTGGYLGITVNGHNYNRIIQSDNPTVTLSDHGKHFKSKGLSPFGHGTANIN